METVRVGQWVAVAYNRRYYLGQVVEVSREDNISVNYLAKKKAEEYRWPTTEDTDTISGEFIFYSQPQIQQVGTTYVLNNEDQI